MTAITATPKSIRPHVQVAEIEEPTGHRWWSKPMRRGALEVNSFLREEEKRGAYLSDLCCSSECWCETEKA